MFSRLPNVECRLPKKAAQAAFHSAFGIRNSAIRKERGYILLAILLMLALIMIAMVAVAPQIATQIKRDREDELIHRGGQYRMAIRRYFRKFGRYPAKIEDLESANNMRFLRKRYKDPITGQDFKLIHYGEQKTQARGFFGQPLTNSMNSNPLGTVVSPLMSGNQNNPQTPLGGNPSNTDNSGNPPNSPNSPAPTGPTGITPNGPTFGGGAIIGVSSSSTKPSIHVINGKSHYNEWEFIYDPAQEALMGGNNAGAMPTSPGTPISPGSPIMTPNQPPPQQPPQQVPQ